MEIKYKNRLRTYRPRRHRAQGLDENRTALLALEHNLQLNLQKFIHFSTKGTTQQIQSHKLKAQTDLQKTANEMQSLAQKVGQNAISSVRALLDGIKNLLHSPTPHAINQCYILAQALEITLKAA